MVLIYSRCPHLSRENVSNFAWFSHSEITWVFTLHRNSGGDFQNNLGNLNARTYVTSENRYF